MVLAFGIDELDAGNPDFPVGTRAVFDGGFRFEWSANGRVLLELFRLDMICASTGRLPASRRLSAMC
ncbi:hypothetical protein [Shinella zoogloeoides]|uniref:hypothetical protein n=1 Tax=Shinella TaxID=323620 RepID=UPI003917C616